MNKTLIWITAAVAGVGFGIPAYAAMSSQHSGPETTPSPTVVSLPEVVRGDDAVTTVPSTPSIASVPVVNLPVVTTANSVEDSSGSCAEAGHANDDRCTGIDDPDVTTNTTANTVEDVSGPCDEAEHANDPRCTGAVTGAASDDNSGHAWPARRSDDGNHSGHGGGSDG